MTDTSTLTPLHCAECSKHYQDRGGRIVCPNGHTVLPRELDLGAEETLEVRDGHWYVAASN